MTNWIKYSIIAVILFAIFFIVANSTVRHTTNVATVQEVELGIDSVAVGKTRTGEGASFDKESLVSNLILEVVEKHKEQGKDVKVDYVFLDENNQATEEDGKIKSVQFKVSLLDNDGKVISTSTQRVKLVEG